MFLMSKSLHSLSRSGFGKIIARILIKAIKPTLEATQKIGSILSNKKTAKAGKCLTYTCELMLELYGLIEKEKKQRQKLVDINDVVGSTNKSNSKKNFAFDEDCAEILGQKFVKPKLRRSKSF